MYKGHLLGLGLEKLLVKLCPHYYHHHHFDTVTINTCSHTHSLPPSLPLFSLSPSLLPLSFPPPLPFPDTLSRTYIHTTIASDHVLTLLVPVVDLLLAVVAGPVHSKTAAGVEHIVVALAKRHRHAVGRVVRHVGLGARLAGRPRPSRRRSGRTGVGVPLGRLRAGHAQHGRPGQAHPRGSHWHAQGHPLVPVGRLLAQGHGTRQRLRPARPHAEPHQGEAVLLLVARCSFLSFPFFSRPR